MNVITNLTEAESKLIEMAGDAPIAGRIAETGLPTRRVEAWHYTDLRNLLKQIPDVAERAEDAGGLAKVERLTQSARLPFLNGHYAADAADPLPEGVTVETGTAKSEAEIAADDAIGLIGAAMTAKGLNVSVAKGAKVEQTVGLLQQLSEAGSSATDHRIEVGAKAKVSFIERHISGTDMAAHANAVTRLMVNDGAEVTWAIVQKHGNRTNHLGQLNVTLLGDAKLTLLVLNAGGSLVRQEVHVDVVGEGAYLDILGVNLVRGGSHVDVTTSLTHQVPNTTATETFRNVVTGDGRGVFQGRINVCQPAQKTDAQMACNTLLLSDEADFSAKPELEIFADDVVCAHGATVTDIEDDHLFYLRARGIGEPEARALLVKAFVDEIFDDLEDETFAEALVGLIDAWLDENG